MSELGIIKRPRQQAEAVAAGNSRTITGKQILAELYMNGAFFALAAGSGRVSQAFRAAAIGTVQELSSANEAVAAPIEVMRPTENVIKMLGRNGQSNTNG